MPQLDEQETQRLQTVARYGALDIFGDKIYENITEVASVICHKPFAVISMIHSEKLWIKSSFGVPVGALPLERSFCQQTIRQKGVFMVEDASHDSVFFDAPLVAHGPKLNFYAGVPLIAPNGHVIGTLSVADNKPNSLTDDQLNSLLALGRHVMTILNSKLNEMKLIHASKMAALGEMAGGIAHEINNPLAIIMSYAQSLTHEVEQGNADPAHLKAQLRVINETVVRISKIVKGLIFFSGKSEQGPLPEPVLFSKILDETLGLCRERFRSKGIEIRTQLPFDPTVVCQPTQLSQVLMNLLNNSYSAVSSQAKPWVEVGVRFDGSQTQIYVKDSGSGIPQSDQGKLMQPFFTTKETGKGVGLSLSISKGIMEEYGGSLSYDPTASNTQFVLTVPVV